MWLFKIKRPHLIKGADSAFTLCENATSKVGVSVLAILCVWVVLGVLSRLIMKPILVVDELSGYMNVAIVFLIASESLRRGQFVKVTFLTDHFLGDRRKKQLRLVTNLVTFLFIAGVCFYGWLMIITSFKVGMVSQTMLGTPIYTTQLAVIIGLTLITIRLMLETIKREPWSI